MYAHKLHVCVCSIYLHLNFEIFVSISSFLTQWVSMSQTVKCRKIDKRWGHIRQKRICGSSGRRPVQCFMVSCRGYLCKIDERLTTAIIRIALAILWTKNCHYVLGTMIAMAHAESFWSLRVHHSCLSHKVCGHEIWSVIFFLWSMCRYDLTTWQERIDITSIYTVYIYILCRTYLRTKQT